MRAKARATHASQSPCEPKPVRPKDQRHASQSPSEPKPTAVPGLASEELKALFECDIKGQWTCDPKVVPKTGI
eukprot:10028606-Heterocapsa_arctica.AAC.1